MIKVTVTAAGRALACRLPVTWEVQVDEDTRLIKAGFVTFPSGKVTEDTSAPSNRYFYDRAYAKWLPVWRQDVSPDGKRYAYTEGNALSGDTKGKVHIVDVASGLDKVLYSGSPIYNIVNFTAEGIYLTGAPGEGRGRGLWLLNPAGGAPRLISSSLTEPMVWGGTLWGFEFNNADKHPAPGGLEGPMNQVIRLDPVAGVTTSWYYQPGADLWPLGFDQNGHPLIGADTNQGREVWLITSARAATRLVTATNNAPGGVAAQDRHGVWFSGPSSPAGAVWLYAGGSLRVVATATAETFAVAGGCIP